MHHKKIRTYAKTPRVPTLHTYARTTHATTLPCHTDAGCHAALEPPSWGPPSRIRATALTYGGGASPELVVLVLQL